MAEGKKKGRWHDEARNFQDYKEAIREILNDQPPGSAWAVEIEVRRSGNPIHQYRIVLGPVG
jgi:hypothetical protein